MATPTTTTETGRLDEAWIEDFGQRYLDAWNSHDPDRVLATMNEDIVYDDSAWPTTMRGHGDVREFLEHTWRAMPDLEFEVLGGPFLAISEPKATAYWRATATLAGPIDPPGFAPTNQRVTLEGFDYHEYRDGKISRLVIVFDPLDMARQIGAMPEPGTRAERFGVLMQRLAAWRIRRRA
jgi:steroid delta-isomerase-like uncharacterized protein